MKKYITRKLRKTQTPYEHKLWQVLRNRGFANLKFRRQYKIGNYVVDFVCLSKKLVIELDGGYHNELQQMKKDIIRQNFIENKGYKIIRFWNSEITKNIDGVLDKLLSVVNNEE